MKTFYLKAFARILSVLLFGAFIQNAAAANHAVLLKKLLPVKNNVSIADTPRQVSKQKKVVVNRDPDKVNIKDKDLDKDKKHPEDGIDDDISARLEQETARTKDPAINAVPTERLIQARRIKDRLVAQRANLVKSANVPGGVAPTASISDITWSERGPSNVGGRTRALMFDLGDAANGYKKVFAGGVGGGLWVTNDITASPVSWSKIDDFFENIAISCIAQNPVNPQEIYAGTGEGFYNGDAIQGLGVWKSTDGGVNWTRLISTSFYTNINAIAVDKNGSVYLAARDFGIMKSGDGGSTWSTAISTTGAADVQMAPNGDVYACDGVFSAGHIYLSDFAVNGASTGNSGTWTNITPNTSGVITPATTSWWRIKLACAPGDANTVYALFEGTNTYSLTSVQRYNKTTNTWAVKTVPTGSTFNNGQAWYSIAVAVDPTNANIVYAGSLDGGKSTDGGATWTVKTQWYVGEVSGLNADQYVHADHHAYVYAPGSATRLLMGTDGGIFYTSTATAVHPSFADRNNGYNVTQFYSVALHPANVNYALAGAQDNGTQQFSAAAINPTTQVTGGDGGNTFIDQLNGNIQLTSYVYNNFWVSTDGVNFIQHFFGNTGSFINPSDYDSNSKNLYSGYSAGGFFRWNNISTGTSTSTVSVTAFNGADITSVTVAPITGNRVYFGLDNGKVAVVDNANTGTSIAGKVLSPSGSGTGSVSCVAVDPASEDHILVSYFNYGYPSIFETKNATAATPVWTLVEGNLPDMPVRWAMFYPGATTKAIIATEVGVWSTDLLNGNSTNWAPSNSGLANVEVDMLKFRASDRTLAAATHGRGLFTTILPVIAPTATDATLSNFTINHGTLSPAFAPATTNYTASVSNATTSVSVTPTVNAPGAKIKVNGRAVVSGTASINLALAVGKNTINTVVTSPDGTATQTYTLIVTRLSNNAILTSLKLSPIATLTTVSGPDYKDYTTTVVNSEKSVKVIPTSQDTLSTIMMNGVLVKSGATSNAIALNAGPNVINTVVTAQDGTTIKTYKITVTRLPSTDATLATLTFSPAISKTTVTGPDYRDYVAKVGVAFASISVTPVVHDSTATVKVNGVAVASGATSAAIPLHSGANVISTVITAQDGVTTKTYKLTITRLSNNAELTALSLSPVSALTLVSGPDYKDYTASAPNTQTSVKVIATTQDSTAAIKVNGTAVASGVASGAIALNVGANVITTVVTASDGVTIKTYKITITRQPSTDATLSTLSFTPAISKTTVSGPDYKDYVATVANSFTSISVTPVVHQADATVKVNGVTVASGATSAAIPLVVGSNIINTVITAQDGVTTKTYSLNITRKAVGMMMKYDPQESAITADGITIHQNISPNGDGKGDIFVIDGITAYPDNKVQIMSRSGVLVYEAKGYDNATKVFDGHSSSSGKLQKAGTYVYSLEYKAGGETKHKTGFIVLKY